MLHNKNKTKDESRISIKTRARYVNKKTLYKHRYKMLKNYEKIYRLLLVKKNRYCIAGLYDTVHPGKPDIALLYLESRYFNLKTNLSERYEFGKLVGLNINKLLEEKKIDGSKILVLDLKGQKKINYQEFIKGVKETLDKSLKYTF